MPNTNLPKAGRPRAFEKPVAWLFGPQLIGGLKGILLYTAYGNKLDPRDWMTAKVFDDFAQYDGEEFWFDYLSDAGDGTKAMYSLAYLTLCRSLWTTANPAANGAVKTTPGNPNLPFELPRGKFLFVGGDTAYHEADYMTLVNRIQHPFKYAFVDLAKKGLVDDERRPIFGIPGNHDYYDQVDGFRRQFRKPIRPEGPLPPARSNRHNAQLTLAGFKRVQEASYVSLHLPYDWWFWGLDIEPGPITRQQLRQRCFFRGAAKAPDKLIVATSAPSTVFGRGARKDQFITTSLRFLGVSLPFFPRRDKKGKPDFSNTGDNKLKEGQCRLDLSGDVHQYARYWGPATAGDCPRKHTSAVRPSSDHYASVVSGLGGAFHHPSTTYDNEICEQVLYPAEKDSRAAVADQLFKFWKVWQGGYVWLAGLILSFILYLGVAGPESSRQFISNFHLPHVTQWPSDLLVGSGLVLISLLAILGTIYLTVATTKIFSDQNPYKQGPDPHWKLWLILIGIAALVIVGFAKIYPYRYDITPFISSLLVLHSLIAALGAIVLSIRYSDYLFKKSFVNPEGGVRVLQWACWIVAVAVVGCGFWFFGQNNRPAYLVSDIVFTIVLVLGAVGLFILPFKVAGDDLLYTKPKWVRGLVKPLIGVVHLILQLLVPYFLISTGSYLAWVIALVLLFLPIFIGRWLLNRNTGIGLLLAWIIYGGVMLLLPQLVDRPAVFLDWTGRAALVPAFLAGLTGAVICCLWTGWYFAVCFAFNGHNNEVGGAARIENFKQFIRFRLTRDGITGYVIAVDDVSRINTDDKGRKRDGSDLEPRLIDVFHLTCK